MTPEGWVPELGESLTLAQVIDLAFDYRGNTTVVKVDGSEAEGYIFNRNNEAPEPFIQMFDLAGNGPFKILYSEIQNIKFTGKDTAADNSWAAWIQRKEREKAEKVARLDGWDGVAGVLVLTAVELEARDVARELELPRLPHFPFPVYESSTSRPRLRVAPAGLRAALLPDRWAPLVADLGPPLVISAGICGALASGLRVGDLILPESVLGLAGERLNVTPGAHRAARRLAGGAWTGLLLTSSSVVATPEAKAERWHATGASAVDMESAAIIAWASCQGCPTLVVRAVADTARQHLPTELASLVSPEGKLRTGRAVALALTRPRTIRDALVLRRGTAQALKSVARLIAALVV